MLFAANIVIEQEVIVATITIALLYLRASGVHQHTFNRSLPSSVFTQRHQLLK